MRYTFNTVINAIGITYWLDNINSIIGIIVGSLTLVCILINLYSIVKNALKDGKIDEKEKKEIQDALNDAKDALNEMRGDKHE